MSRPGPLDRLRQTRRLLRSEGFDGVAARVAKRVTARVAPPGSDRLPVSEADLERAAEIASAGWVLPAPLPADPGEPLTVAWVTTPPGPGSGGHTTMFRLIKALERAGHRCVLYLWDEHAWDLAQHERNIRSWWPWIETEVRDVADGIEDAHAIFATGWESAYPVLASSARGVRCYLVQDYEPAFYPAGSRSLLAEATYRFGFHGVTAGHWLSERLAREFGMAAEPFQFGRDLSYALDPAVPPAERAGICFYARPVTPRRSYELALLVLRMFHKHRPDVPIHVYGEHELGNRLPFPVTDHGLLTPAQLNDLYNRCVAGLVLSATNVSLVPHEMLAAGCIPVVNAAEHNRIVLDNDHVAYAPGTPFELADALCALVDRPRDERAAAAAAAAGSVNGASWDDAGDTVVRIVEDVVRRATLVPAGS